MKKRMQAHLLQFVMCELRSTSMLDSFLGHYCRQKVSAELPALCCAEPTDDTVCRCCVPPAKNKMGRAYCYVPIGMYKSATSTTGVLISP